MGAVEKGRQEHYTKAEVGTLLNQKADKSDTYTKTETDTALNAKADKSSTYTKTETDTALNSKADKTTTYTKTESDTALNAKADKTVTYTKTETDTALNAKADKSSTYTKTETDTALNAKADKTTTYTKTEVDELLGPVASLIYESTDFSTGSVSAIDIDLYSSFVIVPGRYVVVVATSETASRNYYSIEIAEVTSGYHAGTCRVALQSNALQVKTAWMTAYEFFAATFLNGSASSVSDPIYRIYHLKN